MKFFTNHCSVLAALTAALVLPQDVDAHGYLKSPRSRNYHASVDPVWWGGTDSDPEPENCPHCLNIGGTAAVCGLVGEHNYDYPPNAVGGILAPILQACYEPGSIIELETILTAHHKGHFTYKACGIKPGEVPTSECFDANPLKFVSDELYGANPDPNYPERAYIPNKELTPMQYESVGRYLFRHKFRLPEGLSGDLVLLQWHYVTANSCLDVGYDTYNWKPGFFNPADNNLPKCGVLPPDGRGVPEQFWNCAEVKISSNCNGGNPTPPSPTPPAPTTTTTTTSTIVTSSTTTKSAELVLDDQSRCGTSELDARENCKSVCVSGSDCGAGEWCWGVHANYCGSIPQRTYENPIQSNVWNRCGVSEAMARTFCGEPCTWQCSNPGETCLAIHSNYCDSAYTEVGATTTTTTEATSTTTVPATTTINTGATVTTVAATSTTKADTTTTAIAPPPATPPSSCPNQSGSCGPGNPCSNGMCCSKWGYCGTSADYCGDCCQSNCKNNPPSPSPPTPPTPTPPTPTPPTGNPPAVAKEDSRLIAYVGNWQSCPTPEQTDAYTHIVIAFAVSYTWSQSKNNCDTSCNISPSVPICNNQNNQSLLDSWRAQGKKVILSFGGAGMGGSWFGDNNNCWDHCFGREEALSTALVNIVESQNFDGIDIDYEYCYDTKGLQSGRCSQRSNLYTDAKAQNFLSSMTSLLRQKLDALGSGYELTHAPMDTDLVSSSEYYKILQEQNANLNFLMPQFYNGVTRPVTDGVTTSSAGRVSAVSMFDDLATDLFPGQPHKVVFGFCISDCSGTGSNASGSQAVQVLTELKAHNNGEFACNGGAFFWVAEHDAGGAWSDLVYAEVEKSSGCSNPTTITTSGTPATTTNVVITTDTPPTTTTIPATTTKSFTTSAAVTSTTTTATTTSSSSINTAATIASTTTTTTLPATTTTTTLPSEPVLDKSPRCGKSEVDARERCGPKCVSGADCEAGQWCWGVHANYCGSIPKRIYSNPVQSPIWTRCGKDEITARTFCGEPCTWQCSNPGETCRAVQPNYCDSDYVEE